MQATMDTPWAALSHMPQGPAPAKAPAPKDLLARVPPEPKPDAVRAPVRDAGTEDEVWHHHDVTPRDTLQGLALRYGVTTGEIKHCNDLATDTLWPIQKKLRIPKGKARVLPPVEQLQTDLKPAILRSFRVKNKISESEARYYLESMDWNVESAQAECEKDANFAWRNRQSEKQVLAAAGVTSTSRTAGSTSASTGHAVSRMATNMLSALGLGTSTSSPSRAGAASVPSTSSVSAPGTLTRAGRGVAAEAAVGTVGVGAHAGTTQRRSEEEETSETAPFMADSARASGTHPNTVPGSIELRRRRVAVAMGEPS